MRQNLILDVVMQKVARLCLAVIALFSMNCMLGIEQFQLIVDISQKGTKTKRKKKITTIVKYRAAIAAKNFKSIIT